MVGEILNPHAMDPTKDTVVVHVVVDSATLCVGVGLTLEPRSPYKLATSAFLFNAVEDY